MNRSALLNGEAHGVLLNSEQIRARNREETGPELGDRFTEL